ncbi:hypothetical protein H632_c1820p0 [Helicosporidium sp. ATCC 50920]|nr:hypothetical protein H632_c1820p0 [Helicosporidium sp. ATCC 50920]|eukprot:KDD73809.1 hypothetical protein H632_c1820p0 [Helicosporidium sp. ATCC 50920]
MNHAHSTSQTAVVQRECMLRLGASPEQVTRWEARLPELFRMPPVQLEARFRSLCDVLALPRPDAWRAVGGNVALLRASPERLIACTEYLMSLGVDEVPVARPRAKGSAGGLDDKSGASGKIGALVKSTSSEIPSPPSPPTFHKPSLVATPGAGIKRVARRAPSVFNLDVAGRLTPRVEYLGGVLGVRGAALAKLLVYHPTLLSTSETGMQRRLDLVRQETLLPPVPLATALRRHPQLLSYSLPRLRAHFAFFKRIGAARRAVAHLLAAQPQVWGLSVATSLQPKWWFFARELGGDDASLFALYNAYLTLSLRNRSFPRVAFVRFLDEQRGDGEGPRENESSSSAAAQPTRDAAALRTLILLAEAAFLKRLDASAELFEAFVLRLEAGQAYETWVERCKAQPAPDDAIGGGSLMGGLW